MTGRWGDILRGWNMLWQSATCGHRGGLSWWMWLPTKMSIACSEGKVILGYFVLPFLCCFTPLELLKHGNTMFSYILKLCLICKSDVRRLLWQLFFQLEGSDLVSISRHLLSHWYIFFWVHKTCQLCTASVQSFIQLRLYKSSTQFKLYRGVFFW